MLAGRDNPIAQANGSIQILIGNAGDNRLSGGGAIDVLTGGDGSDTFVCTTLQDGLIGSTELSPSFERITDFDLLNSNSSAASAAACFCFGSRSFVGINDAVAGYNPAQEAIVELSGYIANGLDLSGLTVA